jgi:anaerobic selenocysteine-containing dehydrogenase
MNTNQAAANAKGEPTWTDATYLVGTFTDGDGKQFQRYITAEEAGFSPGGDISVDDYLVSLDANGNSVKGYREVPQGSLETTVTLDLNIEGTLIPIECKTAFTLLKEAAESMTLSEYSSICGVSESTMIALADKFASHGKKAVAMTYRGPVKHTNGLYNQWAIQHLNTLIGNYDWKGGCMAGGGGWGHKSGVVSLSNVTGDPGHGGIRIDRAKTFYNQSEAGNLFTGYPAKRPWFPFGTHGNYQEVIPSVQDQYPYGMKVLITYWNAWPYSTPALKKVWEETVADENKLPLLISNSALIGEVAAWADYVLPDTTYLEKFAVPGVPWRVNKGTSFQQPVVGAFDGKPIGVSPADGGAGNTIPVDKTNDYMPALPDTKAVLDIQIGLAKALGLPGVGDDALLGDTGNPVGDLHNSWDWAKAQLQNIAINAGVSIQEILAKGGVFDDPGEEYTDEQLTYKYGNIIRTFSDPVARTKDSVTGEYYSGVPQYKPITHSDGTAVSDHDYPFKLITYKTVHHGQARTNVNPWLMLMLPENFVEISAGDASALRIETGDRVKIHSASNREGIVGKARVTQGLKPGVVAVSHHYGHWESHSRPIKVDGSVMPHDPSRGAGIQSNVIMRTDKQYPNVGLQEPVGGSCSFFDTWVKVRKV